MAFTYPDWIGAAGEVLLDRDMALIFERAIYNGLYFAIQEESMEGLLMPVDTLLADERRLTDVLDVIQFGDSVANVAKSTADVMITTVGAPSTGTITTKLAYAKAEYDRRVEEHPGLKAAIDTQMKNQLVERKNLELVLGIFSNKANAVSATSKGHLSYGDLLNMSADMADRGYIPTHFLTTHALMSDLLKADELHNTYNKMQLEKKINTAHTAIWEVPAMGWKIVATRWMANAAVGGTNYCVGWNEAAYTQEVIRERPQARMYDLGDGGINMLKGTIWWEEYGIGPFPASGGDAVSYVTVA
jgi:hypothetical protein